MAFNDRTRSTAPYRALVFSVFLVLPAILGAQTADWKPYPYPADGFQASFPSLPEIQKKAVPTESGPVDLRTYTAQWASAVLSVGVCDYGSTAAGKDPARMLQGAKNGTLINSGSHLIGEKDISAHGIAGLAYQAQNDSRHFTVRIFMRGSVIYQTVVVTPLGKPFSDTARFLDSFQLTEKSEK
jgi:hypothetical protein